MIPIRGAAAVISFLDETIACCALTSVEKADALNTVARLQWHLRDADRVADAASIALEASRVADWSPGMIQALCTRSESAALLGFVNEAIDDALAAQDIAEREHVSETAAPTLALGTAIAVAGRMNEALPILTRSLHSAEKAGDPQAMVLAQVTMQATRFHIGAWDTFIADAAAMD